MRFISIPAVITVLSLALPAQAAVVVPSWHGEVSAPALQQNHVTLAKNNKKKKKTHVSGSVGTSGGKVKAGNGRTSVGVNSHGTTSVSVKPKGSNVRLGVNSKGKIRIGF